MGQEDPHYRKSEESEKVTASFDYFFMGKGTDEKLATFLGRCLRPYQASAALMVPAKGPTEYAIEGVLHYLSVWGISTVVLKCDQEPSVVAIVNEVKKRRDDRTMVEHPPKADHQSNAHIEGEIKMLEGLTRSLVHKLEQNLGVCITAKSRVLPWAGRHAGFLRTRFAVGYDGKTAWLRLRGQGYKGILVEFGESVFFKFLNKTHEKLDARWASGIFLGRRDQSDEAILGTSSGIEHARSIRRKPESDRWNAEEFSSFVGVPWNPKGTSVDDDRITQEAVSDHGATDGCHGCAGTSKNYNAEYKALDLQIDEVQHGATDPAEADQICLYLVKEALEQTGWLGESLTGCPFAASYQATTRAT
jgi:hypothetical protein